MGRNRRIRISQERITVVAVGLSVIGRLMMAGDRFSFEAQRERQRNPPARQLSHKMPKIPVTIDGVKHEPEVVREYFGRELHTVLDRESRSQKFVRMFTTSEAAEAYVREASRDSRWRTDSESRVAAAIDAVGPPPGDGYIDMYSQPFFGGWTWHLLEYRFSAPDFSKLQTCNWFHCATANSHVVSLDLYVSGTTNENAVVFFSGIDYFGNSLWLPGQSWIDDLSVYGWADMANSALIFYFGP